MLGEGQGEIGDKGWSRHRGQGRKALNDSQVFGHLLGGGIRKSGSGLMFGEELCEQAAGLA